MAFDNQQCRVGYVTDGTVARFAIPFPYPDAGVIGVYFRDEAGTQTKISADNYTVADAAIVFDAAPAAGNLVILREMPFVQELDLHPNGNVPSNALEASLDRLVMMCIELRDELKRCAKLDVTDNRNPIHVITAIVEECKTAATLSLQSANASAASAKTCASIQYAIARIWQELTGDAQFSQNAIKLLSDLSAAAGAIDTVKSAALIAIDNGAKAALSAAVMSMENAEKSVIAATKTAINHLDDLGLSDAVLVAKLGEANGAVAALNAAISAYDGKVDAALNAAQNTANGYLVSAKKKADKYIADASKGIGDAKDSALSEVAAHVSTSAAFASASAEAATRAAVAAEASRASMNESGSMVNASLLAHNADPAAHPTLIRSFHNVEAMTAADCSAGEIIQTRGFYNPGDGGAGCYLISDTELADANGMDVILLDNGLAAVLVPDGGVSVEQFGARGNGVMQNGYPVVSNATDDTVSIQRAIDYAAQNELPVTGLAGHVFKITSRIHNNACPPAIHLYDSVIVYAGNAIEPAIEFGDGAAVIGENGMPSGFANSKVNHSVIEMRIYYQGTEWLGGEILRGTTSVPAYLGSSRTSYQNCCGLRTNYACSCRFKIWSEGFYVGLDLFGANDFTLYNALEYCHFSRCEIALWIAGGNQNVITGLTVTGRGSSSSAVNAIGVLIEPRPFDVVCTPNNNTFISPCVEHCAVGFVLRKATQNIATGARFEKVQIEILCDTAGYSCGTYGANIAVPPARFVYANKVDILYADQDSARIANDKSNWTWWNGASVVLEWGTQVHVSHSSDYAGYFPDCIFDSGSLLARLARSGDTYCFRGMDISSIYNSGLNRITMTATNAQLSTRPNGVILPSFSSPCVRLICNRTSACEVVIPEGGVVVFVPLDQNGAFVGGMGALGGWSFSEANNYYCSTASANKHQVNITSEAVRTVDFYVRSSSGVPVNSFAIYASRGDFSVTPPLNSGNWYLPDIPTWGAFRRGDVIYNSVPAVGSASGWICLSDGCPCSSVWTAATDYAVGNRVKIGATVAECSVAGTSGTTAPTLAQEAEVADNTCAWRCMGGVASFSALANI